MTSTMAQDCMALAREEGLPWDALQGKDIVVTGATGLIGKTLVGAVLAREDEFPSGITVRLLVRNVPKAQALFGDREDLRYVSWDATKPFVGLEGMERADVMFHCANITSSAAFVERPVDVIGTTVGGAHAMLELARKTGASLCMLSTMETYGEVDVEGPVREDQGGFWTPWWCATAIPRQKGSTKRLAPPMHPNTAWT
jgi:nucleoside-diphosphate-sugar epimerase